MIRPRLTLSIAAGTCLGAAFLHPLLSPLVVIGLILLIRALVLSDSVKQATGIGFIVGVFKYAGALIWFWHAYPLTWLGVAPILTQLLLIGGVWLLNVLLIAISLSLGAGFLFWLYRRDPKNLYVFPIVFVASEILGSLIFSLFSLGPGSSLNIDFSFGYVGYSLAYLPGFLPLGIIGGVYSLSIFTGGLALIIYLIWFKDRRLQFKATRILLSVLIVWFITTNIYLYLRPSANLDKDIIAVNTRFDSELLSQASGHDVKETEVKKAVSAALQYRPDIVILPEDSRLVSSFTTREEIFDFLKQASPEADILVVDSSRTPLNQDEVTLRAYFFDLKNNGLYVIDKQHFVPQGEYLPYIFTFWIKLIGQEEFISKVIADRSYRPGPANTYADMPNNIPSVLFCSESVSPASVARIWRKEGPNLILHPVSHAWFNDSKTLRYQLDRMLRLQAIRNNVNIVQAGNMAPSLVYKSNGQVDLGQAFGQSEYFTLYRFGTFFASGDS